MSFFIPGKTLSALTNQPIAKQSEAVLLPYVSIDHFPEFKTLAGRFVTRQEFLDWDQAAAFSEAAFSLVSKAASEGGLAVTSCQNLLYTTPDAVTSELVFSRPYSIYGSESGNEPAAFIPTDVGKTGWGKPTG